MRPLLPWCTLSLALLLTGGAWVAGLRSGARTAPVAVPPPPSSSPQLLPAHRAPQPDPRFRWPAPEPLEPGSDWVYGVFTPPRLHLESGPGGEALFFHRGSSAAPAPPEAAEPATFGLRFLRAEPVPYRFQVVGVAGGAEPLVLFVDLESPPDQARVFALAPGETEPAKGIRLERVERVVRESARGGVEVEYAVEVRADGEGPLHRLSNRATHTVGDPVLYFAATDPEGPAELRAPGEGGVLRVGERRYRIDRVDPAADLVRVSRLDPGREEPWTEEWPLSRDSPGSLPAAAASPVSAASPEPSPSPDSLPVSELP